MTTINCHACGIATPETLIDGKDFDRLECPRCYGPGWCPVAIPISASDLTWMQKHAPAQLGSCK